VRNGPLVVGNSYFSDNVASDGMGLAWRGIMGVDGYPGYGGAIFVGTKVDAAVRNSFLGRNVASR
jgi:hypothetical protein